MVSRFTGKTVFVTGGSSGIGLALAGELLQRGARVLLIARDEERLERARSALVAQAGAAEVGWRSLDVADREACGRVLPQAVAEFGPPDVLINSHGFCIPGHFEEMDNAALESQWRVNVAGVWNTVQLLIPSLESRRGLIANVSSVGGFMGTFGYTAYNATKFAVVGLSEALRNEYRYRGVRVQVLCPPDTETPGFERENRTKPEETRLMSQAVPLMQPEAVARTFARKLGGNRFMVTAGFMSGLTRRVKGIAPRIAFAILDGELRKAKRTLQRQV